MSIQTNLNEATNVYTSRAYLPEKYNSIMNFFYATSSQFSLITAAGKEEEMAFESEQIMDYASMIINATHYPHYLRDFEWEAIPDKVTMHDEMLNMIPVIQSVSQAVSTYLNNREAGNHVYCNDFWSNHCDRLANQVQTLIDCAEILETKTKAESDQITNELNEIIQTLPTDVLRIAAQYATT